MFSFDSSSTLAEYKSEFDRLCADIEGKLEKGDNDIDTQRQQAETQYENMQLNSRDLPAEDRKAARAYLKECKAKLQGYQRRALVGSGKGASEADRSVMANATQKARDGNDVLMQSIKTIEETEQVATAIEEQLADNREQINHIQGQVKQVDGELEGANSILKRMTARAKHWWKS